MTEPQKILRALQIDTVDGAVFVVDFPRAGQKVCRWHRTQPGAPGTLKLRTAYGILSEQPKIKKGEPLVLKGRPLTAGLPGDEPSVAFREIRTALVEKITALYLEDDDEENVGNYTC